MSLTEDRNYFVLEIQPAMPIFRAKENLYKMKNIEISLTENINYFLLDIQPLMPIYFQGRLCQS